MPENNTPDNLTEPELKFGYWFVTHKLKLRRILIIKLAVFSVSLYIYSLYYIIDYFFISGVGERAALVELSRGIDYTPLREARRAEELNIGLPQVFGGAGNRFDLIAKLKNKNSDFYAIFKYKFVGPGFLSLAETGFVLPGEEKYLMLLAAPGVTRPRALRVELEDLKWQRISRHLIPNPEEFTRDHTNFLIQNVVYNPALTRDNVVISSVSFTVTNNTAYSYWRVDFPVVLLRGLLPQAVNIVTAPQFRSGETRRLEVSWFEALPPVDKVDVKTSINIFDPEVYMKTN